MLRFILATLVGVFACGCAGPRSAPIKEGFALNVEELRAAQGAVSENAGEKADAGENKSQGYIVMVVNSTDSTIRRVSINDGPWQATALIGRTCAYNDYTHCVDEKRYAPLVQVSCGPQYRIRIQFTRPNSNELVTTGWDPFTADCRYAGGILWFSHDH